MLESSLPPSDKPSRTKLTLRRTQKKDAWEKASILSQIISGSIIAVVGIIVTIKIGDASAAQGRATLEATNRQIASDFLSKLTENAGAGRANLLNTIDIAMPVDTAIGMSVRFAGPVTQTSTIQNDQVIENDKTDQDNAIVNSAALRALDRLKIKDGPALTQIAESKELPDADIAAGVLGQATTPYLRLSEIDDAASISINHKMLPKSYLFGDDSGWIDLTPYLAKGQGIDLDVTVSNGSLGGASVRLQLRLGAEQYDRRVLCEQCAINKESFRLHSNIQMDNQGRAHLTTQNIDPL